MNHQYGVMKFIDAGIVDGIQYVDVLDEGDNPIEYEITLEAATETYGEQDFMKLKDLYDY